MSKLTQFLAAGATAAVMASPATAFAQPAQLDTAKIGSPECTKAYRAYMGAHVERDLEITLAAATDLVKLAKATPKQAEEADLKYHSTLRNAGLEKLTEAAGNVGAVCGASPQQVLKSNALKF